MSASRARFGSPAWRSLCDRRTASRCSGLRNPTSSSSWSARTGASVGGLPLRGPRIIALRALTDVGFPCCRRMNCGKTLMAASALKVNSSLFVLMAPAKTCRAGFKVSMKAWFEAAGRSSSVLDLKLANCAINLCLWLRVSRRWGVGRSFTISMRGWYDASGSSGACAAGGGWRTPGRSSP